MILVQKMIPQTVISLRNYYGRTVQTAGSKFRFACYLYSIDGVSPLPCFTHMYLLHFHLQYENQYQKRLKIDVYLSTYIFLPCLWSWGTKEKSRKGKTWHFDCPKKTEAGRKCGERKNKTRRLNETMKVQRLRRGLTLCRRSVIVPSPPPFLVYPLAGYLKSYLRTVLYFPLSILSHSP